MKEALQANVLTITKTFISAGLDFLFHSGVYFIDNIGGVVLGGVRFLLLVGHDVEILEREVPRQQRVGLRQVGLLLDDLTLGIVADEDGLVGGRGPRPLLLLLPVLLLVPLDHLGGEALVVLHHEDVQVCGQQ